MSRRLRFARLFGLPDQRLDGAALALLLVSLSSPAAAATLIGVPWAVEAPDAAEKRFSLGVDVFGERQESLRIAAFEQFVSTVDLSTGVEQSVRLPGDPELLNRKFDLTFERRGVGPSFGIALPTAGFVGAGKLYSTLTVGAAAADVSLDFHDVTQSEDSTSLRGRGALFETRLDLVATLCDSCPWFTATSYRFESLPMLSVDREPRFGMQGFTVPRDDVRLGRQVQEISSRVGYKAPGGRTASFAGVQHRWTDLDIDDRLVYRNTFSETRLSSRTRLESQATLAVAGVDVEIGGGFFSRLETAVGEGDSLVRLSVAYLPLRPETPRPPPWDEPKSIDLTLDELAWPLAALQRTRPEVVHELIAASGEQERLSALLAENGIDLRGLADRTAAEDGVRPLVLLAPADKEVDLRRRLSEAGVGGERRMSKLVPPMVVKGPLASLVVIFVSDSPATVRRPAHPSFVLASWEGPSPDEVAWEPIAYHVTPRSWTRPIELTHSVCANPSKAAEIIVKIKYGGRRVEELPHRFPARASWIPGCGHAAGQPSHYEFQQRVAVEATRPVVLVGAFTRDSKGNPSMGDFDSIDVSP